MENRGSRTGGGNRRRAGRRPPSSASESRPRAHVEPLHPAAEAPDIKSFDAWPLSPEVQGAIVAMGITIPTPIQCLAIQPVLDGRDVIAKAETGTGKTLAFGAPMMSKIDASRSSVLGLVLCPTRELAQQVAAAIELLGAPRGIRVALIVGGEPMQPQVAALKRGAQVVVGTPGRVLDLYGQRFLSFPWTEFVVLDEADEMLEIGFIDDVKKILSFTPEERQTLLFSATFPPELLSLARESTRNPVEIATAAGIATVKSIQQLWMRCEREDRPLALMRIIEQSEPEDVLLIFCDRRTEVDALMRRLARMPFSIKALHGGYDQAARFRVMSAFRTSEVKALVATDVASRGLDVAHVTHVVNYSVPHDVSAYTHRIGRTGRAGRSGRAITLVSPESAGRWRAILHTATWEIPEGDLPGPTGVRGRASHAPRREAAEPSARRDSGEREHREPRERSRQREPDVADAPKAIDVHPHTARVRSDQPARERSAPDRAEPERAAQERGRNRHREDGAAPESHRGRGARHGAEQRRSRETETPAPSSAIAHPARKAAAPASDSPDRTKRGMTTRERLAIERSGAAQPAPSAPRDKAAAPREDRAGAHRGRSSRPRKSGA